MGTSCLMILQGFPFFRQPIKIGVVTCLLLISDHVKLPSRPRADQVRVAGLPAQVARGPLNSALTPIRRPVELGVDVIIERPTAI